MFVNISKQLRAAVANFLLPIPFPSDRLLHSIIFSPPSISPIRQHISVLQTAIGDDYNSLLGRCRS